MPRAAFIVVIAGLFAGSTAAQSARPAGDAANSAPAKGQPPAAAPDSYSYDPGGRRDPFLNLMGIGTDTHGGRRAEGAAGLMIAEVSVRGVVESRRGMVAMVEGPDKKTLVVHSGDRFADGTVKAITVQGLVIIQDVTDPLSLVKQREVRKLLRSLEDAKQ